MGTNNLITLIKGNSYDPDNGTPWETRMNPANCDELCERFAKSHGMTISLENSLIVFSAQNKPVFTYDRISGAINAYKDASHGK